ncbi:MAG: RecQ family ATP-dependent DNA helicase [Bacteroidetes bacterium]|nr:MAG: RecQ family ATP-dependent DNA helicase [Bacteroidota bacterium]
MQQYWGYANFRPMQEEIIQSVLEGRDTLALLPTGGGKSVCFQVPGLLREGVCLLVSSLIALMKDQVQQLKQRGIRAEALYSGLTAQDIDRIVDNAVYGHLKFLYLSPERLKTDILRERLHKMPVNLIAVDEAHCISQWGYDFRPPYLEIAEIRELLPAVPVIALTATATPKVVSDIQDKLLFGKKSQVFQQSFARQNLAYVVRKAEGKVAQLVNILQKVPGSAVVYVRNRRKCKEIAHELRRYRISADFYHGGLDLDTRSERQASWIAGKTRVIVATNAFGMGIDKADVRSVVHLDLPDSLEAYFQEAGRAGRDGKKAYAVLLYSSADGEQLHHFHRLSFPELQDIRRVYRALGSYCQLATGGGAGRTYPFELNRFAETYQLDVYKAYACLKVLEQFGWISMSEAVYVPATLKIRVSKDTLYDYQLKHPKMDQILKVILRTYQGAFSHSVKLRESQLAKFLKMSTGSLRQALHTMHQANIIYYHPATDQPQLTFLVDRVEAEHLQIDLATYRARREKNLARIKAAIAYAETQRCRSRQLLAYFGETHSTDCGQCDVCLARKKAGLSSMAFQQTRDQIEQLLQSEPLALRALVARFPAAQEEQVLQTLHYLIDEGYVLQKDDLLVWQK